MSPRRLFSMLPKCVTFLSLDAEGMDLTILRSLLQLGLTPELVMAETDKGGKQISRVMSRAGYVEVYRNRVNTAWRLKQINNMKNRA